MRFSCTNVCATARPPPSSPKIAESGTRTSRRVTSAWSVGMFNVHQWKSTENPGVATGTKNAVMPRALPSVPDVRANTTSWVAECIPEFQRFVPLITQSPPSRTAVVSIHVASLPWSGSERPKPTRAVRVSIGSRNSSRCSAVPYSSTMCTNGKLPTTDDSFCRSLCRPSPRWARCSRITAMSRFVPSDPPTSAGSP